MTREFKLINELGQKYSLMDIENNCLLTDPSGLGYSYSTSYEKTGSRFINYFRTLDQGLVQGTCNFLKYDSYTNLVNFIENSEELRFVYKIPYIEKSEIEYYRDILLKDLGKTEINTNGVLSCPISFETTSLWYENIENRYDMGAGENEIRWNFKFSQSRWMNYNHRELEFYNKGHTRAPFHLEIEGYVENPEIIVYDINKQELFKLRIPIIIKEDEKFIYSSLDGKQQISKQNIDGTIEKLMKQQYIDINNNIFFKLPQKVSNITLEADTEIRNATLRIYPYYKAI